MVIGDNGVAGEIPLRKFPHIIGEAADEHRFCLLRDPGQRPAFQKGKTAFKGDRSHKGDPCRFKKGAEPVHFRRSSKRAVFKMAA